MDGLAPLTVIVGAVLSCYGKLGIILDRSRTPDSGLIFNGVENFVDGKPERSELLHRLVGLKRAR